MQTTSRAVRSQRIGDLKKLLRKVEVAAEGSPGLDREIARVFPSAPANVSRSIDALVRLIETELPGWWWTFGYCKLSNDASLYPPVSPRFRQQFSHASLGVDGRAGPDANGLLEIPKWGKLFDEGFHCDLLGGTVLLSMLRALLNAKIALAKSEAAKRKAPSSPSVTTARARSRLPAPAAADSRPAVTTGGRLGSR
jgi:hypothetical protein